jgi:hypothetical protein
MLKQSDGSVKFSKFIVVLSIVSIYVYTATVLMFAWFGKFVPSELTVAYYSFFAVEMMALAWKTKGDGDNEFRPDTFTAR